MAKSVRRYVSIPSFFNRSVDRYSDRVALRMPVTRGALVTFRECTYRQLDAHSTRVERWLEEIGVAAGERVALAAPASADWAAVFLGSQKLGAVVVPLDPRLERDELEPLLRDSEAVVLLCAPGQHAQLESLVHAVPSLRQVASVESAVSGHDHTRASPRPSHEPKGSEVDPEAPALLMYTSGTTTPPKGVVLCHRNVTTNIEGILQVLALEPTDRAVSIVPWWNIYGLTVGLLSPLWIGAAVTYTEDQRNLIPITKRIGGSILIGVPRFYIALWRRLCRNRDSRFALRALHRIAPTVFGFLLRRRFLSRSFRFFVSGGAPLPPEVGTGPRRMGLGLIQGYGLTETSPVVTFSEPLTRVTGTVGRPLPGVRVKIDRPDPDGVGEVMVKGQNVMLGYHRDPASTDEAITGEGWLKTGDIGRLDTKGFLFIVGRAKNAISLGSGRKVYPEEVEAVLVPIPEVLEAIVYKVTGDQPSIAAKIRPNWKRLADQGASSAESARSLLWERIQHAQERLAPYKRLSGADAICLTRDPLAAAPAESEIPTSRC